MHGLYPKRKKKKNISMYNSIFSPNSGNQIDPQGLMKLGFFIPQTVMGGWTGEFTSAADKSDRVSLIRSCVW